MKKTSYLVYNVFTWYTYYRKLIHCQYQNRPLKPCLSILRLNYLYINLKTVTLEKEKTKRHTVLTKPGAFTLQCCCFLLWLFWLEYKYTFQVWSILQIKHALDTIKLRWWITNKLHTSYAWNNIATLQFERVHADRTFTYFLSHSDETAFIIFYVAHPRQERHIGIPVSNVVVCRL